MRVVNIYAEKYDVYIGRPGRGQPGIFGNPHAIGRCPLCKCTHNRREAIDAFKAYFYARLADDPQFQAAVHTLKGKVLGCFCAPKPCHGDVIVRYVTGKDR